MENPMMPEIRVRAKRKGDKLDKMSRIDFSRMYTVEHNVKVYDFGDVHKDYLDKLIQHWIRVISRDLVGGLYNMPLVKPKGGRGDDDDSAYKDSDDEGDRNDDDDDDDDEDASSSDGQDERGQAGHYSGATASGYPGTYATGGYTTAGVPSSASGYTATTPSYSGSAAGYTGSNTSYGPSTTGQGAGYGGQSAYRGTPGYTETSSGQHSSTRSGKDSREPSDKKYRSSSSKDKRRR
jgi:hypothetical protein